MKKIISLITFVCVCISIVGCVKNSSIASNNVGNNTFDEGKAISMVIKDHLDFPTRPSDTLSKELPTGGPQGSIAKVKFTTKVEPYGKDTYLVTLTKDWGITVNGKYAKSSWKYTVTPNSVALLERIDNDYLPNIMK
jgi:hypothetical protein